MWQGDVEPRRHEVRIGRGVLFLFEGLPGLVGVDKGEGLVGTFAQFGGTFDEGEYGVEANLVEEGVGTEVGCADAKGAFLAESATHAYKGGEDEQQGQGDAPAVGLETVEPRDDGAAEDEAHEEPIACGHGYEGGDAGKVHGFGENHVGDDAEGVNLVGGCGVETGKEVAKEWNVGGAGEETDYVADKKNVVCHEVVGFDADATQFADNHHEGRKGEEVATDSGVETPSHDESFPVEPAKVGGLGSVEIVHYGASQSEESEEDYADKVGKNDVTIAGRLFHKRVQRYDFFLEKQF